MFGRNKKVYDKLDKILFKLKNFEFVNIEYCLRQNSVDVMKLDKKVDRLTDSIDEVLKIMKTKESSSKAIIVEAEERMQILSDKIDKLEADKRKFAAKIGGLSSGNNKLKKKNRNLAIDKRNLLKRLKVYEKSEERKLKKLWDNKEYISKKLPPMKSKPQKTRLKNRVKNYQAKNILKEITEEQEQV